MSKKIPITERQNTEESIRYLRAQRHSYSCAKRSYMIRMFISIIWPIITLVIYFTFEKQPTNVILTGSTVIFIATFFMELYEKNLTKIGATIQEQFDTQVFNMKWNFTLVGEKVSTDKIYDMAQKERSKSSELKDWYTGIITNDEGEYTLKAQKTNIEWSIKQKGIFRNFLLLVSLLIFVLLIMIALVNNFLLADFFIILFFPTISLFVYLVKGWVAFTKQVKELKRITSEIYYLLEKEKVRRYKLRFIQDAIYVHGRLPNNVVPDVLYNKLRVKLEKMFKDINK